MIKIVVDLMGADKNARELVSGAIKAVNENSDLTVVLCAMEEDILPVLNTLTYNKDHITNYSRVDEKKQKLFYFFYYAVNKLINDS